MTRTLAWLLLALALTGCASPPQPAPVPPSGGPGGNPHTPPSLVLHIPQLNVNAPLTELHRDPAGVLETPPVTTPEVVGYYADGVTPGDHGPALIAGHVSGRPEGAATSVPGIFAQLHTLTKGATITIDRDGVPLKYTVYQVATVTKDTFPTGEVYGDTQMPELRLVTCGGAFDPNAHSYDSNVIAFARLTL